MNKKEMFNKLFYILKGAELDEDRKRLLNEISEYLYQMADTVDPATSEKVGGILSQTTGTTSGRDYNVEVAEDGKAKVNVPWVNTTYSAATDSTLGLVKQGETVAALETEDDIATVIARVNTLISNLKTAGIIANS